MADGQWSSKNSDKEASHHRINKLEYLLAQAMIQINTLGDKVKELEKEALSQGSQIRRLEKKIAELQRQDREETNDKTRTIVPEEEAISSTSPPIQNVTSLMTTRSEKMTSDAGLHSKTNVRETSIQSNPEEIPRQGLQSLDLNNTDAVSTKTDPCSSCPVIANRDESETVTTDSRSVTPKPTTNQNETQIDPENRAFAHWMDCADGNKSIWNNEMYRRCLLSYIGKIFGQSRNRYLIVESSRLVENPGKELDQLYRVIKKVEEQHGAVQSLQNWQSHKRSGNRLDDLRLVFENSGPSSRKGLRIQWLQTSRKKNFDSESIKAYFDLMCRDGFVTADIGEYLHLSKENIFGGDEYNSQNNNLTYVPINLKSSTIDLDEDRVDLITCLAVLHHVPEVQSMLSQLVRILRPNGYLIIREHDCKKGETLQCKYLNFINASMMIARVGEFANLNSHAASESNETCTDAKTRWEQEKSKVIEFTSKIHYRTCLEWRKELEDLGFHPIATLNYNSDERANPLAIYYEVYQLNKK